MNPFIFLLFAYLATVVQGGLNPLWEIPGGAGSATPSLLLILAVFIALTGPGVVACWAALILGAIVDLSSPVAVLGPHAIGFALGAYVVLQLRSLVFRESVFTMALMTLAAGIFVHLAAVALVAIRGMPITPGEAIEGFRAADELVSRFFNVLYATVMALPVGWLLLKTSLLWGFPSKSRSDRVY